jgi:hypothetical protein
MSFEGGWRDWTSGLCALLFGLAFACGKPDSSTHESCSGQKSLAFVHDEPITSEDVQLLRVGAGVGAERPSEGMALLDLLWQESTRQQLGLPGGVDVRKSRQKVVRIYEKQGATSGKEEEKRVQFDPERLPDGVALTECGVGVLKRDRPELIQAAVLSAR